MKRNPLHAVQHFGQSIWLDYIRRGMFESGELRQLIEEDGLRGVTSNPSIFEKAIGGSHDYDDDIRDLAREGLSVEEIYRSLAVEDVQNAADLFRGVYDQTDGRDGFVSLEASPHLAHDSEATIDEARRLWSAVDRPNVMIKVPATREGLPAIRRLISEGINVNVTLLFGLPRYLKVAEAYLAGLNERAERGEPLAHVASVASFFLSRIDVLVDPLLEDKMTSEDTASVANRLHGQVAVASAKEAYQIYRDLFEGERFRALRQGGARTQRLLWASTSTKNPSYSDVKYVEALIGPETVNTVPLETLNAYRDHGEPAARLEEGVGEALTFLLQLPEVDVDLNDVTEQLVNEGVQKFSDSYDRLMDTLAEERTAALEPRVDRQRFELGAYEEVVRKRVEALDRERFAARLWRRDQSLWTDDPTAREGIRKGLGWLHVAEKMEDHLRGLDAFADEVRDAGFRHVVHMGMGGSSLAPLVFQRTFEPGEDGLPLTVLDTTDPATILRVARTAPVEDTLFIVASKSGTTAETSALEDYFYAKVNASEGASTGSHFVAITDPGTPLAERARQRGYRRTFENYADIGGRYSALSYFGLVPAVLMGLGAAELLGRALRMMHACASCVPLEANPGVTLGAAMGELARHGRDKVTFLTTSSIATLGLWLEQLLAESTGKEGRGLIPVAGERAGVPSVYGDDRFFVYLRLEDAADEGLDDVVAELHDAGHPVVTIRLQDRHDLGQEFFRWEIATATAGSVLGINPFDQPNVQESKDNTNRLLEQVREEGRLPREEPALVEEPLQLYTSSPAGEIREALARFLAQAKAGDYVALMAYLTENHDTEAALDTLRSHLRDQLQQATTLGYGPRFLHSTGQLHKGGPNTGLFLQLTADAEEASIPGEPYSFGVFKRAQAQGDLEALRKHGRRVLRIHLGEDAGGGLSALNEVLEEALAVHT